MKRRALLIGINEYYLLGKLNYARQDAEATADALRRHCGFADHEITLMSCQASDATLGLSRFIELALENLVHCRDLDLLVFGFWGHGFSPEPGRRYLCGMDTEEIDLQRTAVSLDVVKGRLAQVQAENTLLVLDCCQNQPAGRSASAQTMTEGEEIALASLARDIQAAHRQDSRYSIPTVAILNACREGQRAYEWESRGHGVFTAHLLDGFHQGFGGVASLGAWTAERVPRTTMDMLGQVQTPYITIEGKGDIPLPAIKSGKPVATEDVQEWAATFPPSNAGATARPPTRRRSIHLPEILEPIPNTAYAPLGGLATGSQDAQKRQRQWVEKEYPLEVRLKEAEILFRLVPPGEFMMGAATDDLDAYANEKPRHKVCIASPLYVAKFPITQRQWQTVLGENPAHFQKGRVLQERRVRRQFLIWGREIVEQEVRFDAEGDEHPVEMVSWEDCQQFLVCLDEQLGIEHGSRVRLLTEAEWEYACRAGTTGSRYGSLDRIGWYRDNSGGSTHPVGEKRPNAWGLYDMIGNVWEWCEDPWHNDYEAAPTDGSVWENVGLFRAYRGGGWYDTAGGCRSAYRFGISPDDRSDYLGFRLALVPVEESSK